MTSELTECEINSPKECIGEVVGKLSSVGAWLGDTSNTDGVILFAARVPQDALEEFQLWFNKVTKGRGKIEIHT